MGGQKGRDTQLVHSNERNADVNEISNYYGQGKFLLTSIKVFKRSCSKSRYDAFATIRRAMTTVHIAGVNTCLFFRYISLRRRLVRFRQTALPVLLLTIKPTRLTHSSGFCRIETTTNRPVATIPAWRTRSNSLFERRCSRLG